MEGSPPIQAGFAPSRRLFALMILVVILIGAYAALPDVGESFLALAFIVAGIGVAGYLYGRAAWNAAHNLKVIREIAVPITEGVESQVSILIENRTIVPLLGVEVDDEPPDLFKVIRQPRWLALIPPHGRAEASYVIIPMVGRHKFGPVTITVRDPLGLTAGRLVLQSVERREIDVMPKARAVSAVMRAFTTIPYMGVSARKKGWGSTFYALREYVTGDETRFIDWKAFARLQKLMVKEYEAEEALSLAIILPVSESMMYGRLGATIFEEALRLAATLSFFYLARGDLVSLYVLDGQGDFLYVSNLRGKASARLAWNLLSRVQPPYPRGIGMDEVNFFLSKRAPLYMGSGGYFTVILTDSNEVIENLVRGAYVPLLRKSVAGGVIHLNKALFEATVGEDSVLTRVKLTMKALEDASNLRPALASIGFAYSLVGPGSDPLGVVRRLEGVASRWR